MVSRDTVDHMVDATDDLSEVQQNTMEHATEPNPINAQGTTGDIAPK